MSASETVTNGALLEEIKLVNRSLKNVIEASETRLLLKLEDSSRKIRELESEVEKLNKNIEVLEKRQRKNNVLIFGIDIPDSCENVPEQVLRTINTKLQINLTLRDINTIYCLNNLKNKPIKVEFLSQLCKESVLKNCSKLKGTEIAIAHDLTYKERQEKALLRKHLKFAKEEEPNKICKIRKGALYVGDSKYTIGDLKDIEEREYDENCYSAPATPTFAIDDTISSYPFESGVIERTLQQAEPPKDSTSGTTRTHDNPAHNTKVNPRVTLHMKKKVHISKYGLRNLKK